MQIGKCLHDEGLLDQQIQSLKLDDHFDNCFLSIYYLVQYPSRLK